MIVIADVLHAIFGCLEDSLKSAPAWVAFESLFREIVHTVANKMWRDRFLQVCMGSARPWERKLFHTFDGHRFDWRWGLLESLLRQLDEM